MMDSYYFNSSTILKYLRKVLNEINTEYVDSGLRAGFIMKRFAQKYKIRKSIAVKLVLLCFLKDIGCYYQYEKIDVANPMKAAASTYTFLKHCSPLKETAKALLFYNSKYIPNLDSEDYYCGQLISLINQVVLYVYQEYTIEEIEQLLTIDNKDKFDSEQVYQLIKLLKEEPDILDKLWQKNSLFVHEVGAFIQNANYSEEELISYIDMTNFAFEFHNNETLGHTVTTAIIAKELSKLSKLTETQISTIYFAALVHDIGKIKVPRKILCAPYKLEGNELTEMRYHVNYTKEILEGCFSYKIVEIASNHHEMLDGSGYPKGLKALDLSIGDKIIAIADIASALYCKRSYKESYPEEKIIEILLDKVEQGKIDRRLTNHFINNISSIMKLAKEKESIVLKQYNEMKEEYDALIESDSLCKFFN